MKQDLISNPHAAIAAAANSMISPEMKKAASDTPPVDQKVFLVISVALATVCFFTNIVQVSDTWQPFLFGNLTSVAYGVLHYYDTRTHHYNLTNLLPSITTKGNSVPMRWGHEKFNGPRWERTRYYCRFRLPMQPTTLSLGHHYPLFDSFAAAKFLQ